MRYVLDASVAVAALRQTERHHAESLRRCTPLFEGCDEVVVPAIFDVEVMSALVRRGVAAGRVVDFLEKHVATRQLVTLGPRAVKAACAVIRATGLRAADAFYVWVAAREGLILVTLDEEMLSRAERAGVIAEMP